MDRGRQGFSISLVSFVTFTCAVGFAQSDGANIGVTDTLTGEIRSNNENGTDDDDNYGVVFNRFNLSGNAGDITTNLRVDSSYFFEPPTSAFEDDVARLERLTVRYRPGDWTIVAGDYFIQLGRGIVLSIRKVDELGLDVALRGGQVEYSATDHLAMVFAGLTNPANMDAISQNFLEDSNDLLTGASYEFKGLDFLDINLFGVYLQPEERLLEEERDYSISSGLTFEMPSLTDWLALTIEGDAQRRTLAGMSEEGYAGYLVADLTFGDWIFLVEGLYLDRFEQRGSRNPVLGTRYDYNQPPTLERIDQEVLENRDVVGGRLRVERYFYDLDLTVYANGVVRFNNLGEPDELRQIHGFGGFELYFMDGASRISASGGYRDESQQTGQVKSMIHASLDYLQSLAGPLSLHITSTNEFRTLADEPFERGTTLAGFEWAGVGGLTFEFGYDTQNPSEDVRNYFYAGNLFWQISDGFQLRGVGGTQRGGIKCISGVCRDFPEFAGGRLELVSRF